MLPKKLKLLFAWVPGEVVTERLCLTSALWWVLQLAPSAHLFESNGGAFRDLAHYGSERPWQIGMLTLLTLQAAGALLQNRILRVIALILCGCVWVAIAGLFYAGNPAPLPLWPSGPPYWTKNTGVGMYGSLGICCILFGVHLADSVFLDYLLRRSRKSNPHRIGG